MYLKDFGWSNVRLFLLVKLKLEVNWLENCVFPFILLEKRKEKREKKLIGRKEHGNH